MEFDQSFAHIARNFDDALSASARGKPYAERVIIETGPRVSRAQFIAYTDLYLQKKLSDNAKGYARDRKSYRMLLNSLDERKTGRFYDCGFFGLPQDLGGWKKLKTRCDSLGLKAELVVGRPWSAKDSPFPIAYGVSVESHEKDFPVRLQIHRATINHNSPDTTRLERTP